MGESATTHSRIGPPITAVCGPGFCARTFGAALVLRDLRWSFGSSSAKRAIRALSAAAEYARHCRGTLQNGGRRHQAHSRDRRRVSPVESRNPGAAEATGTGLAAAHEFATGPPTVVPLENLNPSAEPLRLFLAKRRRPQIQPKVANGSTRAKTARAKKEDGGRRFVERRRASARQQRSNGALRR